MKEIDFLPEWYQNGRRRQAGFRTQYLALAGMFALMMIWNFASLNSISKATAELAQMASKQAAAQIASKEFTALKNKIAQLQKRARIVGEIDSRIDVASVLAEMSFLIDEKIVLKKVEFIAERLPDQQQSPQNRSSVVRVANAESNAKQRLPLGDVRCKVVINGIAADASYVAALICKLEDSPYFCQVYLSFSKNKTIKVTDNMATDNSLQNAQTRREINAETSPAAKDYQASEFEISCYLANATLQSSDTSLRSTSFRQNEPMFIEKR